jgi:flagellar hook-length control protein FliK
MNNATLEHLLQIATSPRDSGPSATRPRGDAPPFDSLFRQASEPQARSDRSTDPAPTSGAPTPESRRSEAPSSPKDEATAPQDSASNPDFEYVSESAATQDDHEKPERDELESPEAIAVAAVAVKEAAPAAGPAPELAVVEEVDQAIDAADSEPTAESKPKSDANPTPVAESLVEAPATTATAEAKSTGEEPAIEAALVEETTVTGNEQAETTSKAQISAPIDAAAPTAHESKGKARAASKARETDTTTDSAEVTKPAAEPATDQADATAVGNEVAADAAHTLEAATAEPARQDTEAKPSAARAESMNDDQSAASNAHRDQAPAPVRPTATTSAPIAANIQQQAQVAGTTATTNASSTVDATTRTDAARTKDAALSPFARLERNQAGTSRSASGATHSQSTHHVDPARFVSRVARAIHTAQERGAPLQLRLSPPELGAMRIELSVNQGNLTATIETENSSARQVLLENLPALRERLAEQNVKIERFDVDVRRDGSGQQNPATQQQNDQPPQDRTATRGQSIRGTTNQTTSDEPAPFRRTITTSTINVIA